MHKAYSGDKKIKIIEGYAFNIWRDHNAPRPEEVLEEIAVFFYYGLQVEELVKEDKEYMDEQKKIKNQEKPKPKREE